MAMVMDAHAVYGIVFDTLTEGDTLPEGYAHGLDGDTVADTLGINRGEENVEQTLAAVIRLKYDKLEINYAGLIYADKTIIYVKSSKILSKANVVPLNFTAIDAEEKEQINTLADMFGATPQWLMFHGFTEV